VLASLEYRRRDLRPADVDADEAPFHHSSAAAAASRITVSVPAPGRTSAAGADSSGGAYWPLRNPGRTVNYSYDLNG
jgi:hypothetical protein